MVSRCEEHCAMEQTKRSAICERLVAYGAGHSHVYFYKSLDLDYLRQTVYDVFRRFDETGQDQRAALKAKSDKIVKPHFLAGLKKSVKANPTVALSTLAKERAVSVMTIHRGVKQLGLTFYAQGERHLLTDRMREIQLIRFKKLLNWRKSNVSVIKIFTADRSAIRRNNRWIAISNK